MVPAIILAAGRSTRMGHPKALLRIGASGPSFVDRLIGVLLAGGAAEVLVVGRSDDTALAHEVERIASAGSSVRLVENAHADRGQLSSVVAGLNAADRPGVRGVIVMPVDAPLVRVETIRAMLDAFDTRHAPVLRATYHGRHGHPVIFARRVFDGLRHADPEVGAKSVVRAHAADSIDVDLDDPAIVLDVDEPGDYARLLSDTGDLDG
jgi:CTP:molybdopterin cytidylyltransferase MocA